MRTHCTSIWVQAFSWLLGGNISHGTNNVLNKYVCVCVGNFSHGRFHYIARALAHIPINLLSFFIPLTFTLDKCCSLHSNTKILVHEHFANKQARLVRATSIRPTVGKCGQAVTGIGSRTRIDKLLIIIVVVLLLLPLQRPQILLRQRISRTRARSLQIRALHRWRVQHRIRRTLAVLLVELVQTAVTSGGTAGRAQRTLQLLLRVGQKV